LNFSSRTDFRLQKTGIFLKAPSHKYILKIQTGYIGVKLTKRRFSVKSFFIKKRQKEGIEKTLLLNKNNSGK